MVVTHKKVGTLVVTKNKKEKKRSSTKIPTKCVIFCFYFLLHQAHRTHWKIPYDIFFSLPPNLFQTFMPFWYSLWDYSASHSVPKIEIFNKKFLYSFYDASLFTQTFSLPFYFRIILLVPFTQSSSGLKQKFLLLLHIIFYFFLSFVRPNVMLKSPSWKKHVFTPS